jgi:hypothetical protein
MTEVAEATPITEESLKAQLQEALNSGDFKAVAKVAGELTKFQKAREQAELETKQEAIKDITQKVRTQIEKYIDGLIDKGELDIADGLWVNWNFSDKREVGINPSVRLMKAQARRQSTGGTARSSKGLPSTEELIEQYGDDVADTESGMTYRQLYESNTDNHFRYNKVRMPILKAKSLI